MKIRDRWKRIQRAVDAVPDGLPGPQTIAMIEKALNIGAQREEIVAGVIDARTARNLATLNPRVQSMFRQIALQGKRIAVQLGASDYQMISGNRTIAEQDKLYAKGRTTAGPRVTNARGGYSNHNFGVAADFGVFGTNGDYLDATNPKLAARVHQAVANEAKAMFPDEIEWGGDWSKFKDYPHFQYDTGLSLSQMRAKVAAGKSVV